MAPEFFPLQAVANGEFGGSTSSSNTEMDKSLSTGQDPYDPLAVVGFALKFPQEASSVEGFWKMLLEKRCAMTEWPEDRVNVDAFYHPDNSRRGTVRCCHPSYVKSANIKQRLPFVAAIF